MSELLWQIKEKYQLPAIAGALVSGEGILLADISGIRKNGTNVSITADDKWLLAGCTASLTAALLAKLVEYGKLSWQTTIADIFPELIRPVDPLFNKINLWQLLSHSSGLPRNISWDRLSSNAVRKKRIETIAAAAELKLNFEPGKFIGYSILGYVIAGAMAERVMDKPWEELMSEIIFKPLKMTTAGFGLPYNGGSIDEPWGHQIDGRPSDREIPPVLNPAGGVHCSLTDWASFIIDLLRGARGERGLLESASYQQLLSPSYGNWGVSGWVIYEGNWADQPVFIQLGYSGISGAVATFAPQRGLATLFLINQLKTNMVMIAQEVRNSLSKAHSPEQNSLKERGPARLNSHNELIDYLKNRGLLKDPAIAAAFQRFPRQLFLTDITAEQIYIDNAVVTKWQEGRSISSSSQPSLMAMMLGQLNLKPGYQVLEIGAGTGYNAVLMADIVGETGKITTIDIDDDIVQKAQANIEKTGLKNVRVICADGSAGYQPGAPYDSIVLTVSSLDIAPAWIDQLKPDGYLLIPLLIEKGLIQRAIMFRKADGYLESTTMLPCAFMSLRGAFDLFDKPLRLGDKAKLELYVKTAQQGLIDPAQIYKTLKDPYLDLPTMVKINHQELESSLLVWLTLKLTAKLGAIKLNFEVSGDAASDEMLPLIAQRPDGSGWSVGLYRDGELALLTRQTDQNNHSNPQESDAIALTVRAYSTNNRLAQELQAAIVDWNATGREPSIELLKIRAYPRAIEITPGEDELLSEAHHFRFILSWNREMLLR